jgi:hypothetical protein
MSPSVTLAGAFLQDTLQEPAGTPGTLAGALGRSLSESPHVSAGGPAEPYEPCEPWA